MNTLYPIFVKLKQSPVLIVGGGAVAYEKLFFILKNSPDARITVVAKEVLEPKIFGVLEDERYYIHLIQRSFRQTDVLYHDLIIAATNNNETNIKIRGVAKSQGRLVNVADTPKLCDFYLGSIVTKGDLKVAISTNGKSPTFAKRFRQLLEEALPEELNELLENLHQYRNLLTGDFELKVQQLNALTAQLLSTSEKKSAIRS